MQQSEQKALLATLQQTFDDAVSKTGLKPRDVCHQLLVGNIKLVDAVDFAACKVEPFSPASEYVRVTFDNPIADAGSIHAYKWRSPNNTTIVDDNGNWVGVVAYFREWEGFVAATVQQLNTLRVHAINL